MDSTWTTEGFYIHLKNNYEPTIVGLETSAHFAISQILFSNLKFLFFCGRLNQTGAGEKQRRETLENISNLKSEYRPNGDGHSACSILQESSANGKQQPEKIQIRRFSGTIPEPAVIFPRAVPVRPCHQSLHTQPSLTMKDTQVSEVAPPADKSVHYTPSVSKGKENCALVPAPVKAPGSCLTCVSLRSDVSRGQPPLFSGTPPGEDDEVQTETQDYRHFWGEVGCRSVYLPKDFLCEEYGEEDLLVVYQRKLRSFYRHKFKPDLKGELQSQINSRLYLTEETPQQQDSPLHSSDLFRPRPGAGVRGWSPGTVLTVGEAGVGKSLLLQHSLLDWCEGTALEDVQIVALLSFSELNILQNQSRTLLELLEISCPSLSRSGLIDLSQLKLLLMLDALDECLLSLDFSSQLRCSDISRPMPVETLVTHLLKGDLLPNTQLWITSRPTAISSIPPTLIHRITELHGFTNHHKEVYFLQHLQDENLRAQLHSCTPVYSLCCLPLVCSITAQLCVKTNTRVTQKQMFVHLLAHHMKKMQQRYRLHQTRVHQVILALSRLAWEQLQGRHLMFCEEELEACGVEVKEAVVYSGLCTQVPRGRHCGVQRSFSFVHPSVQEGLASLFLYEKICSDPNRSINLLHCLNQMIQEETQRPNQDQDSDQDQDQNQNQNQNQGQDRDQDQDQDLTQKYLHEKSSHSGLKCARFVGPKPRHIERIT